MGADKFDIFYIEAVKKITKKYSDQATKYHIMIYWTVS